MSEGTNRPRNHLVTDATTPYKYTFVQYGKHNTIMVDQSPKEETWPGGALWDIGVLLSHVVVVIAGACPIGMKKIDHIPPRLLEAFSSCRDLTVLELGCGVGLSGLAAAAAMGTKLTILTDLQEVVDGIARPNLIENSDVAGGNKSYRLLKQGKRGRALSMPLCWGNAEDEDAVLEVLKHLPAPKMARSRKSGKGKKAMKSDHMPDIVLIGDVAYQHKPGAASHFDALVATLLRFLGDETTVIFGTRMRMPASADLLDMFLQHMDEVIEPIPADEIDPSFAQFKHHISIHVMRKKKKKQNTKLTGSS